VLALEPRQAAELGPVSARVARLIARYAPRTVIALGDNFHDGGGPARLSAENRGSLIALQRGRDWIWIAGNHDPEPVLGLGGTSAATLVIGALTFGTKGPLWSGRASWATSPGR
jgi:metallophosphoesterase superfamily enzyme